MFLIPRPSRSIDVSSPLGILGTFTNGLIGGAGHNPVSGTTKNIPSNLPNSTAAYSGLIRFGTARKGAVHFNSVYASTANISNLFSNAISQLAGPVAAISNTITGIMSPFSNPIQLTVGGKPALYRADEDAYTVLISDMSSKMADQSHEKALNVQKYTNTLLARGPWNSPSLIPGTYEYINSNNRSAVSPLEKKLSEYDPDILDPKNSNTVVENYSQISRENEIIKQLKKLLTNISPDYSKSEYSLNNLTIVNTNRENGIDKIYKYDAYSAPKNGYENNYKLLNERDVLSSQNFKGFPGSGQVDKINILTVLEKDKFDTANSYQPYNDDQIAFYFHDFVNDRYIPFRATVKGISENAAAEWDMITYVGRADKLYNYKGFTRQLNFGFHVIANSIKELLPMWTRINYLATCVKPSGYKDIEFNVESENLKYTSKFVIPPLMAVTIGDFYKEQPIIIQTIAITIPDDALWETLSEKYAKNNNWTYLQDRIIWNDSHNRYAQFPRECEIQITSNVLEQSFPQIGKHNFGGFNSPVGSFSKQLIVGQDSTISVFTPTLNSKGIKNASPGTPRVIVQLPTEDPLNTALPFLPKAPPNIPLLINGNPNPFGNLGGVGPLGGGQ
jgi:hypothetical protein